VNAVGGDYINAVVEIDTELNPYGLLYVCQSIEHQFGRERPYANAPRTLDLDILFYEGIEQTHSELTIPHPRIAERSFVILPLLEICPDFFLPNYGPLKNLLPNIAHQRITRITCKHCDCEQQLH
jgi:2-amino-4-hydroxy-6-hydroxymethyldihydropteridine diphosphokinase